MGIAAVDQIQAKLWLISKRSQFGVFRTEASGVILFCQYNNVLAKRRNRTNRIRTLAFFIVDNCIYNIARKYGGLKILKNLKAMHN